MVTYRNEELVSSSEISKKFGTFLNKVSSHEIDKLAVLKNNEVKAVLIDRDEYERMSEALEIIEHIEIYNKIKDRINTPLKEAIDFEDVLKEVGLNLKDLES